MISPLEEEKNALTNRPPKSKFESQICVHNLYWRGFSSEVGRNSVAGRQRTRQQRPHTGRKLRSTDPTLPSTTLQRALETIASQQEWSFGTAPELPLVYLNTRIQVLALFTILASY